MGSKNRSFPQKNDFEVSTTAHAYSCFLTPLLTRTLDTETLGAIERRERVGIRGGLEHVGERAQVGDDPG
jgi:hypothetical protein